MCFYFIKQQTSNELRIIDWSSDVCSSDLSRCRLQVAIGPLHRVAIEPEQRLELPEHQLLIVQAVGNKIDAERNAIVGERLAMAESGRASCRARVGQSGWISAGGGSS